MDTNMSVPKVEVENPSTLDICEHLLPAIKDWEIGKKYFVKLEVEVASLNQGGMYNPNDSKEVRASFRVLGAQSLEAEESPKVEENNGKNNSKEAFVRAVVKAANDYTEN